MSDPFIAEIKIFAGNFAPRGYAYCDGQLLPIAQNTALFSLIGTIYGGDGRTTTALPNLKDRVPLHKGNGPGLSPRSLGQRGGQSDHTLTVAEMPNHTHTFNGSSDETEDEGSPTAAGRLSGVTDLSTQLYKNSGTSVPMAAQAITNTGGGQSHNNLQPYLTMHYIIALTGLYPSRS